MKDLEYIQCSNGVEAINLGTGIVISVLDLGNTFERGNGIILPYSIGPRCSGEFPAF